MTRAEWEEAGWPDVGGAHVGTTDRYSLRTAAGEEAVVSAASLDAAEEAAREWAEGGEYEYEGSTVVVEVDIFDADDGERLGSVTVVLDPPTPPCTEGYEHEWATPHEVVGGLEENPGVWSSGPGVRAMACCPHCGTVRVTDGGAQDSGGGYYTSVRYDTGDYVPTRTLEVLAYYGERGRAAADALGDDEALAGDESWCEDEGALAVEAYRARLEERRAELAQAEDESGTGGTVDLP